MILLKLILARYTSWNLEDDRTVLMLLHFGQVRVGLVEGNGTAPPHRVKSSRGGESKEARCGIAVHPLAVRHDEGCVSDTRSS